MGAWRSIRHRLDDAARASSPVAGVTYVGRSWRASPSEGYPTAHQLEQDRIVAGCARRRRGGLISACGNAASLRFGCSRQRAGRAVRCGGGTFGPCVARRLEQKPALCRGSLRHSP